MASTQVLQEISLLARQLNDNKSSESILQCLASALRHVFPFTHMTVLAYDATNQTLTRVFTNRPDTSAPGGRKRLTNSYWAKQIIEKGEIIRGSTKADLVALFPGYETLKDFGCESSLNIPVRVGGSTVGTINIFDRASKTYDDIDLDLAFLFAQLAIVPIGSLLNESLTKDYSDEVVDYV